MKNTLPFKEGWIISFRAISSLISELFNEYEEVTFVLTRRLNQDPVEVRNLFDLMEVADCNLSTLYSKGNNVFTFLSQSSNQMNTKVRSNYFQSSQSVTILICLCS